MSIPGSRTLNLVGFAACVGMMAYALYAEHRLLLAPCPLCVFQRIAVVVLGIVFLLAALHKPHGAGRIVYALVIGLTAAAGVGIAGRHVWLQSLPADQVPACGPGLDYIIDSFPLSEALKLVFTGSGECATADWHFLGLSMPAWVLVCVAALGALGIWNNGRKG
ncbi:MAG TPA: disulfide bond formation protein B [Woeseiaceae bacterium]|nr:disulfide bond formation protein B [Woeseiaceae bacterium]